MQKVVASAPSKLPVLKKKRTSVVVAPPKPYGMPEPVLAQPKPVAVRRAPPTPLADKTSGLTLVHLDGLPGSGKSYMSSRLAQENEGYVVLELDEITQRPGSHFGFENIGSKADLEAAFQREIVKRLANARVQGATVVLVCGVSKIISEEFGEVTVVPGNLCTAKLWIDIAPSDVTAPYPVGALAKSVARLETIGVSKIHAAEVAESAERAVLRDLRDTEPAEWAAVAADWGDDSRFYAHMVEHHPDAKLGTEAYESLFHMGAAAAYKSPLIPHLADWTALVLDDMTGRDCDQGEQYHKARTTAMASGYKPVHWSLVMSTVVRHCNGEPQIPVTPEKFPVPTTPAAKQPHAATFAVNTRATPKTPEAVAQSLMQPTEISAVTEVSETSHTSISATEKSFESLDITQECSALEEDTTGRIPSMAGGAPSTIALHEPSNTPNASIIEDNDESDYGDASDSSEYINSDGSESDESYALDGEDSQALDDLVDAEKDRESLAEISASIANVSIAVPASKTAESTTQTSDKPSMDPAPQTEKSQRADMLTPFLTPETWQGSMSYSMPTVPANEYVAAAAGMLCDVETDLRMLAGTAEQLIENTTSILKPVEIENEQPTDTTQAIVAQEGEYATENPVEQEDEHMEAPTDVSTSMANMSITETAPADDEINKEDAVQQDTSDEPVEIENEQPTDTSQAIVAEETSSSNVVAQDAVPDSIEHDGSPSEGEYATENPVEQEDEHMEAPTDVSTSMANMSITETAPADDEINTEDAVQQDTSDEPEVSLRNEKVVRGTTRTRSGRPANTISYAESSDEDEQEESFVLDDDEEAPSSDEDEFASAEEEDEKQEDLSKLKVPELKARLKELGAPVKGKKAELIERLTSILADEEVAKAGAEEAGAEEAGAEEANDIVEGAGDTPSMATVWSTVQPNSPSANMPADRQVPPPPVEAPPVAMAAAEVVADPAVGSDVELSKKDKHVTGVSTVLKRSIYHNRSQAVFRRLATISVHMGVGNLQVVDQVCAPAEVSVDIFKTDVDLGEESQPMASDAATAEACIGDVSICDEIYSKVASEEDAMKTETCSGAMSTTVSNLNMSVGSFASFAASMQSEEDIDMENESLVKSIVNGDDEEQEDLSKLKVPELKARLKELGAPVKGKKAELIERLTSILAEPKTVEQISDESMPEIAQPEPAIAVVAPNSTDAAKKTDSTGPQIAKVSINISAAGAAILHIAIVDTTTQMSSVDEQTATEAIIDANVSGVTDHSEMDVDLDTDAQTVRLDELESDVTADDGMMKDAAVGSSVLDSRMDSRMEATTDRTAVQQCESSVLTKQIVAGIVNEMIQNTATANAGLAANDSKHTHNIEREDEHMEAPTDVSTSMANMSITETAPADDEINKEDAVQQDTSDEPVEIENEQPTDTSQAIVAEETSSSNVVAQDAVPDSIENDGSPSEGEYATENPVEQEDEHMEAPTDVSTSMANMSITETAPADDEINKEDAVQQDTSDEPEVSLRNEKVVRGTTRTRSGRPANTISYAESSDEDEQEESFVLDDDEEAPSSDEDEFASAEEEDEKQEDLSKLKVPELKARLKELGAPVKGKKAELIERLTSILADEEVAKAGAEEAGTEEANDIVEGAGDTPSMATVWSKVQPNSPSANMPADRQVPPPPVEAPPVAMAAAEVVADPAAGIPAVSIISCEQVDQYCRIGGGLQDVTNLGTQARENTKGAGTPTRRASAPLVPQ